MATPGAHAIPTGLSPPPPEVIRQYNELVQDSQRTMRKIAELEMERNEHKLVEETLQPLESERRAYRMVGEVLVERTVGEVLPSVTKNRENVRCRRNQKFCRSYFLEARITNHAFSFALFTRIHFLSTLH
jgi:chaperonin cofactor prefoldin